MKQILDAARAEAVRDLPPPPLPLRLAATPQEQASSGTADLRHAAYELAPSEVLSDLEADGDKIGTLGLALRAMITKEGPIHRDEITRRLRQFLGKRRLSPRVAADVKRALDLLQHTAPDICHEAGFWFTAEQKNTPIVRDRSAAPASLRRIAMISTTEISAAIALARQQNGSLTDADIAGAVASLLSLAKPSAELRALVRSLAT